MVRCKCGGFWQEGAFVHAEACTQQMRGTFLRTLGKQKPVYGYKLLKLRRDGSLGPLFINATLRVPIGKWLEAESHPTKGYAFRPGWHCTLKPVAPHLGTKGRVWCRVALMGVKRYARPESQGGTWLLAERMKVIRVIRTP